MSEQFFLVQFAEARQPEYKENKAEGYINYGAKNDYPEYLVDLFNKSAKHNAIIRSKVHYINGNGWSGNENFINRPNRIETLEDISRKITTDIELFGGSYIQVIWGLNEKIVEIWHIDYTKIRTNKDNTQYWFKNEWKDRNEKPEVYLAFNPKHPTGSQIYYAKEYRPAIKTYSLPSYFGALNYIESDIEVSKHVLGNAKTGFSASKLITLPNGEPTEEEKNEIHKKFKNTYTGADGIKYMLSFVNDPSRKPIIDDLGQSDLTKEDFGRVDSLIQTNIFSGHQITTPSIFGIAEPSKLGSRTEMRDGYEIFKNTYVNGKQKFIESFMNMFCGYFGYEEDLKIIPCEAVGIEFSENILAQIAPKEWLLEKAGIDITKYQTIEVQQPQPVTQSSQFSQESFQIFYALGEDKNNFNVWKQKNHFEDIELYFEMSKLQIDILGLISKDKKITPEVIASTLNEDLGLIKNTIKNLEELAYLKSKTKTIGEGIDSDIIIERTLTRPLSEIQGEIKPITSEFLVRYSYEWITGYSNSDKKTSREFCLHLLEANKMYTRQEIETMSAALGYSVWDRRGGWWTQPDGSHSESCRHKWTSNIVTRK